MEPSIQLTSNQYRADSYEDSSVFKHFPTSPYKVLFIFIISCLIWLAPLNQSRATIEFSYETELACVHCHEDPKGGGTLTPQGNAFRSADYELTDATGIRINQVVRLILGFLHILASFIWLGTIFYVHLFMGPRSLSTGLPKAEVLLGRLSILAIALTGIGLTIYRIPTIQTLWTTTFGIVWLVKTGLFILMIFIAAGTTTIINKMLQTKPDSPESGIDGTAGQPAHVIVNGRIYDVSASKNWEDGVHMKQHRVGQDLTEALKGAPHGEEMLELVKDLGPADEHGLEREDKAMQIFIWLARSALVLGVLILFCVAYWKWGPALVKMVP